MEAVAFVIGVLVMVVGLGISIALHEIGHLLPAKLFGVRVGQYMVGMGPTVWSRRRGETEYGLKALPIGGYISMAGMYPPSPALRAVDEAASTRRRARLFATMVQDAQAANDETLDGADDPRAFYRLPVYKRITIMLGGPVMNLVLAVVLFAILLSGIGIDQVTNRVDTVSQCVLPAGSTSTECSADDPPAPAAQAGILPGDLIVSVDGQNVTDFSETSAIIQAHPGESIPIVVSRHGSTTTLTLTPVAAERQITAPDGSVSTQTVGFAGVTATIERSQRPLWEAPAAVGDNVAAVAQMIVQLPQRLTAIAVDLVTGGERDANGPMSVVGVGRLAGEVAAADAPVIDRVAFILNLLASLNVALFVFNLIPLLPLDGGHILVALWDALRRGFAKLFGRPAPAPTDATRLVPVTFVVVVLLIAMGGLLIVADIFNPVRLFGG